MKKIILPFLTLVLLLASCSGSEEYRGDWKATDMEGTHADIHFEEKSLRITHVDGKVSDYEYTQNEVKNENGVRTFGIKLGDGRKLQIYFPLTEDSSKGLILDANNHVLYTISRDTYLFYNDLYAL